MANKSYLEINLQKKWKKWCEENLIVLFKQNDLEYDSSYTSVRYTQVTKFHLMGFPGWFWCSYWSQWRHLRSVSDPYGRNEAISQVNKLSKILRWLHLCLSHNNFVFLFPRIIEQCLNQMPEGDVSTDDAKCVPPSRHEMKVYLRLLSHFI